MSNRTWFDLEVESNDKSTAYIILELVTENEDAAFAFCNDGSSNEELRWPDYELVFRKFSKKYPKALFILRCEGEDGDRWIHYFLNGKDQFCQGEITFPEYDPSKLT